MNKAHYKTDATPATQGEKLKNYELVVSISEGDYEDRVYEDGDYNGYFKHNLCIEMFDEDGEDGFVVDTPICSNDGVPSIDDIYSAIKLELDEKRIPTCNKLSIELVDMDYYLDGKTDLKSRLNTYIQNRILKRKTMDLLEQHFGFIPSKSNLI